MHVQAGVSEFISSEKTKLSPNMRHTVIEVTGEIIASSYPNVTVAVKDANGTFCAAPRIRQTATPGVYRDYELRSAAIRRLRQSANNDHRRTLEQLLCLCSHAEGSSQLFIRL